MSGQIRSRDTDRTPETGGWIPKYFNKSSTGGGPLQVDLFAVRHNAQLPQYFSFKPDPGAVAVDAFTQEWSSLTPYAFPPFLMVGRCLHAEDQGEGQESSNSDPSMEEPSMVPSPPPHEHQQSLLSSPVEGSANEPSGRTAFPHGSGRTSSDRLAGVRQSLESRGISKKAVSLICASWRRGTEKSYSSAWGLWQGWCSKGHTDPLLASLSDIANFLSSEFKNGKQYSTLNTYRSAMSATRPPIEGYPLGQHPIVGRLLQGMLELL